MGLKSKLANRILDSKLSSVVREKKVVNLDSARLVGILWETGQQEAFIKVKNELYLTGIQATGLCYFPTKKALIPEEINGFSRKQTSWWLEIPRTKLVEDFIHEKFDILIDLSGQKTFPLIYATALSEAAFKVGYAGNSTNYFDLNIEFQEEPQPAQLAEQILYYLKRINKTTIE
jgi:hypothetical protein